MIANNLWIGEHCLKQKGSHKEYKAEWEATLYRVSDKIFALQGKDKNNNEIITLKLLPEFGRLLREQYSDIQPGYYMNKDHWNSVLLDGNVPEEVLKGMIDASYNLIVKSLTKKTRQELGLLQI